MRRSISILKLPWTLGLGTGFQLFCTTVPSGVVYPHIGCWQDLIPQDLANTASGTQMSFPEIQGEHTQKKPQPDDSSRDLFIPDRWRSQKTRQKGHVSSPSLKRSPAESPGMDCFISMFFSYMGVSKNSGIPKSSILIGFSIINHPFWGIYLYLWKHPYTTQNRVPQKGFCNL